MEPYVLTGPEWNTYRKWKQCPLGQVMWSPTYVIMTSWYENGFCITEPLWEEFTCDCWIPLTKGQWWSISCLLSLSNYSSISTWENTFLFGLSEITIYVWTVSARFISSSCHGGHAVTFAHPLPAPVTSNCWQLQVLRALKGGKIEF